MENSGGSRPSDKVGVGEGRGHSRLRDKGGGAGLQKTFFFGHSVFSVKINGGGGPSWPHPLDPPLEKCGHFP